MKLQGTSAEHYCPEGLYETVIENEFGYCELKQLPSDKEREAYYKEKYYQESCSTYATVYSEDEIRMFDAKLYQKELFLASHMTKELNKCCFLDVGCGEGFALRYFDKVCKSVVGLDYSVAGVCQQNPQIVDKVIVDDIYNSLLTLKNTGYLFDIINMDNVLEHVVDPKALLKNCKELLNRGGGLTD